jgi:poly-D-alanine transfer protein DltD
MKQLFLVYLFPFILSLTLVCYISDNKQVNNFLFQTQKAEKTPKQSFNFIGNFEGGNSIFEDEFLKSNDTSATIFLLGSSELVYSSPAIPYNFIPQHFKTKLKAIGHAGNQCFSIYTQLLANYKRLNNAPLVIIISPGWFESKASKGTTSKIFLEFNSESFLKNINTNPADAEFTNYAGKRVSELYNEFNSPNLQLKLLNFTYRASITSFHKILYYPLICSDAFLIYNKEKTEPVKQTGSSCKQLPIISQTVTINWDSLFTASKNYVISQATNNTIGVENTYFTEHINGKTGEMQPVSVSVNEELQDFMMLLKLLKAKNVKASFIISPLNPLYYKNLNDLTPTVTLIENEIKDNKFPYLNMFEPNGAKYNKAILRDIMHMSDYGWYKVDRFICNTYHLTYENK